MPTSYPTGYDSYTAPGATMDLAVTHSQRHSNIQDALVAVENALGLSPAGADASIRARLDRIDLQKTMAYDQEIVDQGGITTEVNLAYGAAIFTAVAGRRYKITAQVAVRSTVAADVAWLYLRSSSAGPQLKVSKHVLRTAGVEETLSFSWVNTVSLSGAKNYPLSLVRASGTGTLTSVASAVDPMFILVEDIGLL